jgi:mRNA interferase YafQ
VAKAKPGLPEPSAPLLLETTSRFERDLKLQEKRGKSLEKLHAVIEALRTRRPLDPKHRDHPLGGERQGWRDCHVEPDWVLIYR